MLNGTGGGLHATTMDDESKVTEETDLQEEQTQTADDTEIVPETEQEKTVVNNELKARNEKLFARAKKAEEAKKLLEAKLAKYEKPKAEAKPDTSSEIEEKVELRLSGLSLEQIKLAQKLRDPGQSLSDSAKANKSLLDALAASTQQQKESEDKIPTPTSRSQSSGSKPETYFGDLKDDKERRNAFERMSEAVIKRAGQPNFR